MHKLKHKLIFALVITSFVSLFILSCYNVFDTIRKNDADLKEYRGVLFEQFDRSIKLQVETAYSLVQDIYNQQQQGLLPEPEAKKRAADLVRNLRYDNGNGYFWIDTTEGVNVVLLGQAVEGKSRINLTDKKENKFIQDIIAAGSQPGGGYADYWFPKKDKPDVPLPKRSYSLLFQPYKWVLGTGNYVDDIDNIVAAKAEENRKKLLVNIGFTVLISIIGLIVSALIAVYISKKIAGPVATIADRVQQIASGNLAVQDLPIDGDDEIGVLSKSFNSMKKSLGDLIKHVASTADQVAASSEELTATSDQVAQAAGQVATSISDVAVGTSGQVRAVGQTTTVIEQMSTNIQQVAASIDSAAKVSGQTATAAKSGEKAIETAITQMRNIEQTVADSAQVVVKLGDRSKEIGQIVDTISGIAGQTNLLALNAAIEAARAGEQGRGFAVVAEEVRKLAEQSQEAAKQIADLIGEIQQDTDKAVSAMDAGTREVKVGTDVVTGAGHAFGEIAGLVNDVSFKINDVSAAINQLTGGSQKIVSAVQEIDKITKSNAEQTQTVSAATEEQSAAMQEIAAASQSLAHLASSLQNAVSKFTV